MPDFDFELNAGCDWIDPFALFQEAQTKDCRLIETVGGQSTLWRMPEGPVKLTVHAFIVSVGENTSVVLCSPRRCCGATDAGRAVPAGSPIKRRSHPRRLTASGGD